MSLDDKGKEGKMQITVEITVCTGEMENINK
jgi:hypothetical protein